MAEFPTEATSQKSFWKRPEGVTGIIFLIAMLAGGAFLVSTFWTAVSAFISTTVGLVIGLAVLATILFAVVDPRTPDAHHLHVQKHDALRYRRLR